MGLDFSGMAKSRSYLTVRTIARMVRGREGGRSAEGGEAARGIPGVSEHPSRSRALLQIVQRIVALAFYRNLSRKVGPNDSTLVLQRSKERR